VCRYSLARNPAVGTAYVLDYVFAPVNDHRDDMGRTVKGKKSSSGRGSGGGGGGGDGKGQTVTALTGRLELLTKMWGVVDGGGGGGSSDRLVRFLVPALETPDDRVRSLAVALLVRLYKMENNNSCNGNTNNGSGWLGALSDVIDRHALRLRPAMQKLLMRKLNAVGLYKLNPGYP
jgi:hypothetical protein